MFHPRSPLPPAAAVFALPPANRPDPKSQARSLGADDLAELDDIGRRYRGFLDDARHTLGHSEKSCKGYEQTFQTFRRFLVDGVEHDGITPWARLYDIDGWVYWNRRRGLSPVTINTYWRQMRPFFKYLARTEGMRDPYIGAKGPGMPKLVPKARKPSECRHILETARNYPWPTAFMRHRAVALFGVLIFAGLRRGEVVRVQFGDVDMEEGTILIRRAKGRFGGKDRVAYMNAELATILRDYIRERQRLKLTCPAFFASEQTGQGIGLQRFIEIVKAVRRGSGIAFSIHSLRHSFVTMLLQNGVPLHVAKELAGHASIQTTEGYLRVWDEDKKSHIRKLRL